MKARQSMLGKIKGLLWQIQLIKLITNCDELILFFSAALKHALSRESCHASNNIFRSRHNEQQLNMNPRTLII